MRLDEQQSKDEKCMGNSSTASSKKERQLARWVEKGKEEKSKYR
jgi:hypothetical protein